MSQAHIKNSQLDPNEIFPNIQLPNLRPPTNNLILNPTMIHQRMLNQDSKIVSAALQLSKAVSELIPDAQHPEIRPRQIKLLVFSSNFALVKLRSKLYVL